jgi:hypothetical protein
MSYYRIAPPKHEQLVNALSRELQHPVQTENSEPPVDKAGPTIFEEATYLGRLGVTVVWDEWTEISPEARGRIILDAYRQTFGEDTARNVGVAIGFTTTQFDRMRAQADA